MHEIIKKDILSVLSDLVKILKSREESDVVMVKALSNHTIHNASVFQDEDSVSVAILTYSLSKIIERRQKELDYGSVIGMIGECISNLNSNEDELFRKSIKNIFNFIRTIDEKLRLYISEVITQARIKKGCKLCEHVVSIARASEVLGISQWELMHYLGKTTLIDNFSEPINVSKRLKIARSLFS